MKIAMLSPVAWRTPPRHYGPWELVTSLLTEELVNLGVDITLFATGDSVTAATLDAVSPQGYEENPEVNAKVSECLHISNCFEKADRFDIIHNQFDFLPLTYSSFVSTPIVTTIHGFSSPSILPVYEKYNRRSHYVSISMSDRSPRLSYAANIYHGIDLSRFTFAENPSRDYLLFYGRFHPDKGAKEAIAIAQRAELPLKMAGIIQDRSYFESFIQPAIDRGVAEYLGSVGAESRDQLLGNALALLHPINFNEPFGLSVVEAMATGTPVIAINRGSMPELIDHGITGYLAGSAEEAADFIPEIKKIDRTVCRKTVEERFSAKRMAADYLALYKQILA